jgi:hypothetical protein
MLSIIPDEHLFFCYTGYPRERSILECEKFTNCEREEGRIETIANSIGYKGCDTCASEAPRAYHDDHTRESLVCDIVFLQEVIDLFCESIKFPLFSWPRVHPYVRVIKDLVAGSVLISAFGAMIIGALIFLPYIS